MTWLSSMDCACYACTVKCAVLKTHGGDDSEIDPEAISRLDALYHFHDSTLLSTGTFYPEKRYDECYETSFIIFPEIMDE